MNPIFSEKKKEKFEEVKKILSEIFKILKDAKLKNKENKLIEKIKKEGFESGCYDKSGNELPNGRNNFVKIIELLKNQRINLVEEKFKFVNFEKDSVKIMILVGIALDFWEAYIYAECGEVELLKIKFENALDKIVDNFGGYRGYFYNYMDEKCDKIIKKANNNFEKGIKEHIFSLKDLKLF